MATIIDTVKRHSNQNERNLPQWIERLELSIYSETNQDLVFPNALISHTR
jgi:hypothetical protein